MSGRLWLAAGVALVCGLAWSSMPPPPQATSAGPGSVPVRGVMHVHTRRSDGTGTLDEIAAAAARAGLQFVITTDHGDGTREPEAPSYRSGVLCIDAVEISTDGGHVVALDLPPAPYPLGGEARDVIEDVRRLGGVSIAAHPDSTRAGLSWADWETDVDGLEWLNGDSQWRDETWRDLGRALLTYPFRRAATLSTLLDRPDDLMHRWDTLLRRRSVVAVAASDAHARLGFGGDPYRRAAAIHVPSYEQVFRTFSISLPGIRLTGAASQDARAVLGAIRHGQVYSTIDGLATPAVLAFSAVSGVNQATFGDRLSLDGSVAIEVQANAPAGARAVLFKDGEEVASSASTLDYAAPSTPAVYRVEVQLAGAPGFPPVPWIVSNPIYVGHTQNAPSTRRAPATTFVPVYLDGAASGWRIEKNPRSDGTVDVVPSVGGTQLWFRYGIGGVQSEGPYVAAVIAPGPAVARSDRIMFSARAARPMRLSIQLRTASGAGARWRRSVYLDDSARTTTVFFDQMTPVGSTTGAPVLSGVEDILFVVDTINAEPGSGGQLWLDDVRLAR